MSEELIDSSITIIAIGNSHYDHLENLEGPNHDIINIKTILSDDSELGIYPESQIFIYSDLTICEIQEIIIDYTYSRSATGDKLLFYFSGHGATNTNDFYFCMKDTKQGFDNKGILPLSALPIREIINTLSSADVLPCFIIDACFSGTSIKSEQINIGVNIDTIGNQSLKNSYAILASSGLDAFSYGDKDGGFFTKALINTLRQGLGNLSKEKYLSIQNVSTAINEKLSKDGYPLVRLHIGRSYPELRLCRNKKYKGENRIERMIPSYKEIFSILWNNGNPISIIPKQFRADYPSAYGNYKKMIYIWGLLTEGHDRAGNKILFLSQMGIQFCKNELKIPKEMMKNNKDNKWEPKLGTTYIKFDDL